MLTGIVEFSVAISRLEREVKRLKGLSNNSVQFYGRATHDINEISALLDCDTPANQ